MNTASRRSTAARAAALAALLALTNVTPSIAAEPAAPQGPYADCRLIDEAGDSTDLPQTRFDPANPTLALPVIAPSVQPPVILCLRDSFVPALYDYRVLIELHLPLYIKVGDNAAALGADGKAFTFAPLPGQVLPAAEIPAIQARLTQMWTAMQADPRAHAASPPHTPPKVDLAKAYAPADLALLKAVIGQSGIPQNIDMFSKPMAANGAFAGCGSGAAGRFTKAYNTRLAQQAEAARGEMAAQFDPPFTHDELVRLTRLYQLTPFFIPPPKPPKAPKLKPAEIAEAEALRKDPAIDRYLHGLTTAIAPVMESLADVATDSWHDVCPARADQRINSTGLQSETWHLGN